MRKSTVIALLLLLLVLGGMLFVADAWLGSLAPLTDLSKRLTRQFEERGELAAGARVLVAKLKVDPERPGVGLLVELRPAAGVLGRKGGLRALARTAAAAAAEGYGGVGDGAVRRVRLRLLLPDGAQVEALLLSDMGGQVGEPDPALPERWPPTLVVPPGAPPPHAPPAPPEPAAPVPNPGVPAR